MAERLTEKDKIENKRYMLNSEDNQITLTNARLKDSVTKAYYWGKAIDKLAQLEDIMDKYGYDLLELNNALGREKLFSETLVKYNLSNLTELDLILQYITITRNGEYITTGKNKGKYKRLYTIWSGMISRCENENNPSYKYYGQQGKRVCDEWKGVNGFGKFHDWALANGYKPNLSIDRIDNSKGYSPNNCHWVDAYIQNNNKSNNVLIEINGEKKNLTQIARSLGINRHTLQSRIKNSKWDLSSALTRKVENCPLNNPASGFRYIYYLKQSKNYQVSINNVYYGIRKTLEEALQLRELKLKELKDKGEDYYGKIDYKREQLARENQIS